MSVLGWCFLIGGAAVLWLLIVFVRLVARRTDAPKQAPTWQDRIIDNWPNDPIDRHIDTAAALLQPDAPHLPMSELDAAIPSKPISEEEDRVWRAVVAGYRFTAAPVVPGGES